MTNKLKILYTEKGQQKEMLKEILSFNTVSIFGMVVPIGEAAQMFGMIGKRYGVTEVRTQELIEVA